ncbi:type III secretion system export apparatus subunit SctV [Thalassomonas actiniarum]|uniref:Type III secretion system export apparatus subunit SctV n=1 Tax=Thalassomonas actiniarum TaxID=485447 RepID=A0AAE9YXI4_9GAMM|nr:type III secretion system export apparatus subunit SctV [Thalassomonas actiniarum]WDE02199.1 type III secretion system export apparatus subunit SctV [Thalassomonas actiniarum]
MNQSPLARFFTLISQRNDVLLAVFLVSVIFMMIMPLPTWLVDVLIAANMSIAVTLLMLAVYIQSPLELSVFPGILLATTLFRLALSITTTRLILLEADAGKIVEAFGNFVVGGNLVVGGVIFLILTVVQFLVITKGSERVAEVSARFSLDSMPGKQMSIDGDMRAGVIDQEEATQLRSMVQRESQLYGSMDGAMKFVKGDAIAGLVITAVNIIGGIAIGMGQLGLSGSEALHIYSILTIGDGLVAQIPSLFISITAGFIVTRVKSEDKLNLGNDMGQQLTGHPKALMIGGILLAGFAFIPGFPTLAFLAIAGIIGGSGFYLTKRAQSGEGAGLAAGGKSDDIPEMTVETDTNDLQSITAPLILDIDASCKDYLAVAQLNEQLKRVRHALYMDLGVPFPGIHLRYNAGLKERQYQILLQEIPVAEGILPIDHLIVREAADDLDILAIPHENPEECTIPGKVIWVEKESQARLEEAGIHAMDTAESVCFHLSYVLKRYAGDFIGIQETRQIIENMEKEFGELVKEVQRLLPLQKITDIFQRLVTEDISIRSLRCIFESLVEWAQKEKDTILLTEYVRGALNRQISYKYSNDTNILSAYLLTQDLEETVRAGIRQTSSGAYLALEPAESKEIIDQIQKNVGDITSVVHKPVLVVSLDIRRYIRKLVERDFYDLAVLSFQELTQDINVQPLARVGE